MIILPVLWTAFFVINFNIAMMIPLLPFIEQDIGLSPVEAGFMLAAFPVVALISNLALGPFIDRYGRKRFIIAGAVACAVLLLLTAFATSPLMLTLARAATGIFMPMIGASVFAAIADYVPEADRSRMSGYVTSAAPIAFLCAISLGVWLGGLLRWQIPVIGLGVVCFGLAIAASTLPPADPAALSHKPISGKTYRDRLLSLSLDSGTRLLLVSYFCWSAGMYVFLGAYPSWLVQHALAGQGVGTIGLMLLIGELGGLSGALLSGRLGKTMRHPISVCAIASAGIAAVLLTIPFGTEWPVFQALAYGLFAFGRDLMLALLLGGAMLFVAPSERGSLNAILNAVYQTGASAGGMASAWLYGARSDFSANAIISSGIFVISAVLLHRIATIALVLRERVGPMPLREIG
jgi:predicted MFS family arabinose efflux permease